MLKQQNPWIIEKRKVEYLTLNEQSILFVLVSLIILICSTIIKIYKVRKHIKNISIERIILSHIFVFYICGVISLTLLPLFDFVRENVDASINVIPFRTLIDFFKYSDFSPVSIRLLIRNLFGNIIMFVPLGLFASMLNPKIAKSRYIFIIGFGSSLLIEIFQFIEMQTRITGYRSSDIDDIIFNILGCLVGFLIFKLIEKRSKGIVKEFLAKVENKKNIL